MAKKPTITTIASGYYSRQALNTNFENLRDSFDNTLSLDGSTPNSMGADLDMNSNDILNVNTLAVADLTVAGLDVNTALNSAVAASAASAVDSAASAVDSAASASSAALYDGPWLDDVATLLADTTLTLTPGQPNTVVIGDYVRTRKEGFSYEVVASGGDVTTAGGIQLDVLANPSGHNVKAFGAVGDGVTNDTTAIQAALDSHQSVFVPEGVFLVSGISLDTKQQLYGSGKESSKLLGDGSGFVVTFGDGLDVAKRKNSIRDLYIENDGHGCVDITASPNWTVTYCKLRCINTTENALNVYDNSYRGNCSFNEISASGGGWAVSALDNINGLTIATNVMTGGNAGGAIRVGQSQNVWITGNTIEAALKGIYVSSTNDAGEGVCNGVVVDNNYLEGVKNSIVLGEVFIVRGGQCKSNFINANAAASYDAEIVVGRLESVTVSNNSITTHSSGLSYPFRIHMESATADLNNSVIENNYYTGTYPAIFTRSGLYGANTSLNRAVGAQNKFDFTVCKGEERVYISPLITESAGLATTQWMTDGADFGGTVVAVHVIDIQGTINNDARLVMGRAAAFAETLDYNPITTTDLITNSLVIDALANGTAGSPNKVRWSTARDDTLRVIAGTGSGTFRIKISYKAN